MARLTGFKRGILAISAAVVLALAGMLFFKLSSPTIPDNLIFLDLNQKNSALRNYKGSAGTVVIFTATWCSYCKDEIKAAKPIYKEYSKRGIEFLMVFQDYSIDDIRKYKKANKIPWPVVQKTDYVMELFNRADSGVPSAYFITNKGKIVANLVGKNSTLRYPEALALLLEQ